MAAKKKRNISKTNVKQISKSPSTQSLDTPVLFIHPAKQGLNFKQSETMGRPYGLIPVGLPAIANKLRQNGFPVKGINHSVELQFYSDFDLKKWLLRQRDVRVILIDLHWYEHCYGAIQTAKLCKQVHPQAWTVLGGLSASGFAREILENFPEVDLIIRGDGEQPVLQLVQTLLTFEPAPLAEPGLLAIPNLTYRSNGKILENPLSYTATTENIDELDFVDLEFLEHGREYGIHEYIVTDIEKSHRALATKPFLGRWLTTARGCKYECAYCGGCKSAHQVLAGRNGIVIRSPGKVVDDLARLEQAGYVQASLTYDIAELGEEYWQPLFSQIRSRSLKIGLYNEFFQMPSEAFVDDMTKTVPQDHSCVAVSPLSGDERVRRLNGKHFSNDQLFDLLEQLQRSRMYLFVYFSLNLPGETTRSFLKTVELAREIFYFYPNSLLKIINSAHTIDPLSPMNERSDQFGVQSSMKSFMDFYRYCEVTQEQNPDSRMGLHRGFDISDPESRSLPTMVELWDREREGKETSWWPIPPSW
jgi:radical SAM superfamily enzyme YgiQ (UPF0313 family)